MHICNSQQSKLDSETYQDALRRFRNQYVEMSGNDSVTDAFHAVRNLPYFSSADRSPLTALQQGRGACTAKHIILRDLLRELGVNAHVELVEGDFSADLTNCDALPIALYELIDQGGIRDIHCWVRAELGGQMIILDATWPDALGRSGFRVNTGWNKFVDTVPAVSDYQICCIAEDVIAMKSKLLGEFSQSELVRRSSFLKLLSEWLHRICSNHEE